jgi:hypothetical protein
MDATTAGLVGAFGGAAIGLSGALIIDRLQSHRSLRVERRRAFGGYLGALYSAVGEFRDMPSNREGGLFEKLDSVLTTEQAAWVRGRQGIAKTSPQLFGRVDRLLAAQALLQVLDIPRDVMDRVDEATAYVERLAENRTPERREEWWDIRERLLATGKTL